MRAQTLPSLTAYIYIYLLIDQYVRVYFIESLGSGRLYYSAKIGRSYCAGAFAREFYLRICLRIIASGSGHMH